MPVIYADEEASALLVISTQMMHAALVARSQRADPDRILTDAAALQAHKLGDVLADLLAPEPFDWEQAPDEVKLQFQALADLLLRGTDESAKGAAWTQLRALMLRRPFPE